MKPPSVRFLGRRRFLGAVVVLASAMAHGVNTRRAQELSGLFGVDRRTLERWRRWWREEFVRLPFWKERRARLMPPVLDAALPGSLAERFEGARSPESMCALLRFLSPVSVS